MNYCVKKKINKIKALTPAVDMFPGVIFEASEQQVIELKAT